MKKTLRIVTAAILFLGFSSTAFAGFLYKFGTPANPQVVSVDSEVFTSLASCDAAKARFEAANPTIYAGPCLYQSLPTSSINAAEQLPVSSVNVPATPLAVSTRLTNPIKYNNFSDFVSGVTATAVEILMPFVVLAFIWSGFLFVRAQGNEEELKKAKLAIYWSVIGAFILMGAYAFSQIIKTTIETVAG